MSRKKIATIVALFTGNFLFAQKDSISARQLDEVVVTATKYPIKQSLTGKILTVISKEQLQKAEGKTIGEILNNQAGITVNSAENPTGSTQYLFMQGASAGRTVVLIDGIPAYDPSGTSSAFDLNLVSVDEIERIEILKGSQSTLYGSDAVAGVVNIITKKGSGKPLKANVNVSGGSYGTFKAAFGASGQVHKTSYNIQYNKLKCDGFSSAYDSTGKQHFDNDGFNGNTLLGNMQQKINNSLQLKAYFQYNQYKTDLDAAAFTDDKNYITKSSNSIAGLGADYQTGKTILHFNYNYNTVKRTYLDDSVAGINPNYSYGAYTGASHYVELYSNIPLNKNLDLLVGADYRKQATDQHYFSISIYGPYETDLSKDSAKINQYAGYASLILKNIYGLSLELGGRYNHFSEYGSVFTYSFNPSYVINNQLKFFANISSGFEAPTLYQLYSEYRNPNGNLQPEKSASLESGVQWSVKNVNARALYFSRNINNNIVFYTDASYNSYYINQDKQRDHGFELEASSQLSQLHLSANYSYVTGKTETKVNGKDTSYNNLYRRPKHSFNFVAEIQATKKLIFNAALHAVSSRPEYIYGATPVMLASYYTIDFYAEYKICKSTKLYADLKNMTNQKYFDQLGYNSRRFNFMAGAMVQF
ncbi:MAG TPA: TonB-dependent receptor [Puia sp.]|nr:TonB-dependent receptor [Puia sp.]